jgi:hypothetical protein
MEPVISILATALLVSLAGNVILLERLFSKRRRRANSECLKCGYDVRNHSGRCPECGEPVPAQPARRLRTRCSFCGRTNDVAGRMVEGPGDVYICARCVEWSLQAINANRAAEAEAMVKSQSSEPSQSESQSSESSQSPGRPDA